MKRHDSRGGAGEDSFSRRLPMTDDGGSADHTSTARAAAGQDVLLEHLTVRFAEFTAVSDVNLTIRAGEFFSFLGPSGCGKTTILRTISGFIDSSEGAVRIGGRDMRGIAPNNRPTALIFQNLALFPLMRVWENIAFGLEVRRVGREERRRRAEELLELVALPRHGDKLVSELSGGQRQRVAVARALAVEPAVLLLDEPLSALDLKLRQHMRAELRAIQERTGVTFIYITHDQGEALAMSDRVGVMSQGVVEQVGPPDGIYNAPRTPFVASFVGESNAFSGIVTSRQGSCAIVEGNLGQFRAMNPHDLREGERAVIHVRPERLTVGDAYSDNEIDCVVARLALEGSTFQIFLHAGDGSEILVQQLNRGAALESVAGQPLRIGFAAESATALPDNSPRAR